MIEAEARGASNAELRTLKVQHWGGFIFSVLRSVPGGILGQIAKALRWS